jgi:hypothetical protein
MLPLSGGMLDGEDYDFLTSLIDRVVNEVGILSGDQLTDAFNGLCLPTCGNKTRFWSDWRIAARSCCAAAGLRARM